MPMMERDWTELMRLASDFAPDTVEFVDNAKIARDLHDLERFDTQFVHAAVFSKWFGDVHRTAFFLDHISQQPNQRLEWPLPELLRTCSTTHDFRTAVMVWGIGVFGVDGLCAAIAKIRDEREYQPEAPKAPEGMVN